MKRILQGSLIDVTGVLIIVILLLMISPSIGGGMSLAIPPSVLNLNTIFLSILIEALPFVLIGVLIAGTIQIFVTEEHIRRFIPKNRYLAVIMSFIS